MIQLKKIFFTTVFSIAFFCRGQEKPAIDFEAIDNWTRLESGQAAISPRGNYVSYNLRDKSKGVNALIIQSIKSDWTIADTILSESERGKGLYVANARRNTCSKLFFFCKFKELQIVIKYTAVN